MAALLGAAPALAHAQEAQPTTNSAAPDAIGPRELQNFSLPGTKAAPADQAPAPVTKLNPPPPTAQTATANVPTTEKKASARSATRRSVPVQTATTAPTPAAPTGTFGAGAPALPTLAPSADPATEVRQQVAEPSGPAFAPTPTSDRKLPLWPWVLAAMILMAGAGLLVWQRRSARHAFAGGSDLDLFTAPEPAAAPVPRPVPREPAPVLARTPIRPPEPAPQPAAVGIVASRLRPTIEIGVQPLRCQVNDDEVAIDFEIELFNSGTAPARAVLAEASMFNPGETQDRELATFFANPVGAGNRIDTIPPMRRMTMTSRVVAPRTSVQEYEVAGRKSVVPVLAFNALYEWSGGKGQTSAAYLVGRETGHDKLGPLMVDNGAREFSAVGARALPSQLRT